MFPIMLDLSDLKVLLIGTGAAFEKRKKLLEEAGAGNLKIFKNVPEKQEFEGVSVIFAAGLDENEGRKLSGLAKEKNILLNTEDTAKWCNFHVPAMVRRGDLLITSSTGGKSPYLARRIKSELEEIFGEEWAERLEYIANERLKWKKQGMVFNEITKKSEELVNKEGWF